MGILLESANTLEKIKDAPHSDYYVKSTRLVAAIEVTISVLHSYETSVVNPLREQIKNQEILIEKLINALAEKK